MPSPFPGMDPWLERGTEWPGFHDILIVKTVEVLQPQLRSRGYYANPGERDWLTEPGRPIYPDVVTIQRRTRRPRSADSLIALAEPDEPVRIPRTEVEVHEWFVEICDAANNVLVTGIEFLSPANKFDPDGRALYRRKQLETAEAGVHLVEIDLLRGGPHILDIPGDVVYGLRPWDYLANIVRRGARAYEVYPIQIRDRLPRLRIPLKADDEDATLDLQEVFDRSYDVGPYPDRLNYSVPPVPPLSPEDDTWADQLLRTNGLRE